MKDCVATAPTPASAHGTSPPTANQCDCTATPISPVVGSNATMEKVWTGRSGLSCDKARTEKADRNKAHKILARWRIRDLLANMKQRILVYASRFSANHRFMRTANLPGQSCEKLLREEQH